MSDNKEIFGLHRITKLHLKELCKKHQLYQTPHLNDQLYLHYQGFQSIENLEEYTGLKCLWLESNAISEIQGLDCQGELKCLFLQNNLIRKIENLSGCSGLDTLNLASNHITTVENCGVDVLPVLSTLNLSRNYIRSSEGLKALVNCKSLWSLDLSHNRIDDILVVKIFASMPELRVLVLQGNPMVNQVPQYRKTLILECKNLTYLDSRPVFPKDRACAEAWKRGGYEEERKEHERWIQKDRKKIRDSVNATLRLRIKNGDKEVQLITSSDEEEDREPKPIRDTPGDLEFIGVEDIIKAQRDSRDLEIKGEKDGEMSGDREPSSFDNAAPPQSGPVDSIEPSEEQVELSGEELIEEMPVVEKDVSFSNEEVAEEADEQEPSEQEVIEEMAEDECFPEEEVAQVAAEAAVEQTPSEHQLVEEMPVVEKDVSFSEENAAEEAVEQGPSEKRVFEEMEEDERFPEEEVPQVAAEEAGEQEELPQVVAEKAAEQEEVPQVVSEEAVQQEVCEQAKVDEPLMESDNMCEDTSKEDELVTQKPEPSLVMKSASSFSECPTVSINSDTSSSSSEESSDSESSLMDNDTSEDEGDDEDDSRLNEFEPKEQPMVGDVEMPSDPREETENQMPSPTLKQSTIESRPQEPEGDKDGAEEFAADPDSRSFDDLVEWDTISFRETSTEKGPTVDDATKPNKTAAGETTDSSDDDDSGLFNSFQTASSFVHNDAEPLTSETPTNLEQDPPESLNDTEDDTLSQESLVPEEPSFRPEDIGIPDNLEVKSWLRTYLTGLKEEQERDSGDTSSLTDSLVEEFSDSDSSDSTSAQDVTVSGEGDSKPEKLEAGDLGETRNFLDKIIEEISLGDIGLGEAEVLEATLQPVSEETGKDTTADSDEHELGTKNPGQTREVDENLESMSWWERTLAAAQPNTSSAPLLQSDESSAKDEDSKEDPQAPQSEEFQTQDEAEAKDLLDRILAATHQKIDETPSQKEQESPKEGREDLLSDDELPSPPPSAPTSTLREDLDSFNKVVGVINKRREERMQKINDFVNHPPTKEDATQSHEQLDEKIEQIKQEKHERVRQLVEQVYAQKDKYDDTLEVIEGRLMVVKRGTGALEEVQPPPSVYSSGMANNSMGALEDVEPVYSCAMANDSVGALEEVQPPPSVYSCAMANDSMGALEAVHPPPSVYDSTGGETPTSSRYVSCGVSTNSVGEVLSVRATPQESPPHSPQISGGGVSSSESDDYGTPLSDEEVEQHQSDTKIRKLTSPSMAHEADSLQARTRTYGEDEVAFEKHFREEQEESLQRVLQIHDKIDADIFTEVSKWMDEGGDLPSVSPAVEREMGREEIALLKRVMPEETAEDASDGEEALEDVARIFEISEGED